MNTNARFSRQFWGAVFSEVHLLSQLTLLFLVALFSYSIFGLSIAVTLALLCSYGSLVALLLLMAFEFGKAKSNGSTFFRSENVSGFLRGNQYLKVLDSGIVGTQGLYRLLFSAVKNNVVLLLRSLSVNNPPVRILPTNIAKFIPLLMLLPTLSLLSFLICSRQFGFLPAGFLVIGLQSLAVFIVLSGTNSVSSKARKTFLAWLLTGFPTPLLIGPFFQSDQGATLFLLFCNLVYAVGLGYFLNRVSVPSVRFVQCSESDAIEIVRQFVSTQNRGFNLPEPPLDPIPKFLEAQRRLRNFWDRGQFGE